MHEKKQVALLSIGSNTLLIVLKVAVGILSGSVSIISEAIHSSLDLLAAIIAFCSVRISDTKPDEKHPYGHGKFENISGVVEALLIFVAALWIIWEAIHKIFAPEPLQNLWLAIAVMAFSGAMNYLVSKKLYAVAKKTDSIALEADALHLKTDVYTSLGVAAGLVLLTFTHIPLLDPLVAILVALFIIFESLELFHRAYTPLLDHALAPQEIQKIEETISVHCTECMGFHNLRTRKSGSMRCVDFHLTMSGHVPISQAHELCDKIEADIKALFGYAQINIHVESTEHAK